MQIRKHTIAYMTGPPLRTPSDIGVLIRARRRELGLDQAELAEIAGVSRLWINQVEGGKPGAGLGLVLRTLASLGVELSESGAFPNIDAPSVVTPDINAIIENARTVSRK
jgi:HTH-type transcriptional regulator / antitoxin HipB